MQHQSPVSLGAFITVHGRHSTVSAFVREWRSPGSLLSLYLMWKLAVEKILKNHEATLSPDTLQRSGLSVTQSRFCAYICY